MVERSRDDRRRDDRRLDPRAHRGRLARRALALLLGACAALVLAELALRTIGAWRLSSEQRGADAAHEHDPVVLCCGDSNVYGLYEQQADTYPARLQRLLDACTPRESLRVVNVGVPGLNSHVLLQLLPRDLARYRPAHVLLTVGANDFWGWAPDAAGSLEAPPWYESLALVRLARLVRQPAAQPGARPDRASETGTPQVLDAGDASGARASASSDGSAAHAAPVLLWTDREGRAVRVAGGSDVDTNAERCAAYLRANLSALTALCHEHGAALTLLGYGADRGIYARANGVLAAASRELGLAFVRTHADVAELGARIGKDAVYHTDDHPKGCGYEVIARLALRELVRVRAPLEAAPTALPFAGVLDDIAAPAPPRREMRLEGRVAAAPGTSDELAFELCMEGRAGFSFTILLLGRDLPPSDSAFFDNLARDPLLVATLNQRPLRGKLDAHGCARLPLGAFIADPAALVGAKVRAVYVIHRGEEPRAFVDLGSPQEFELR